MSKIHFHAGKVDLELAGSETFVVRQLQLLASLLGDVDANALEGAAPEATYSRPEPTNGNGSGEPERGFAVSEPEPPSRPTNGGSDDDAPGDDLGRFFRSFEPAGDRQSDAALLFAYYLQRREGLHSLQLKDLIRCCIRAGVDTRNFNRTVGALTRRGFLETVRHGHAYRLSARGVAAVESRM